MPLIACPDCGRDVSTIAPSCPHCGRPSPAGLAPLPATATPPPAAEETLWRGTPSSKLLIGQIFAIVAVVIVVPLITRFIAASTTDIETSARMLRIGWLITLALFLIFATRFIASLIMLRSTLYTISNQRVMIETGLLSKALSEIDMRLIDDTQFYQGVFHRLLGIGNVTIFSSDKTSPMFVLRGIPDPRRIRELIRSSSYQVSQRQVFTRAT